MAPPEISIIIPCRNEGKNITHTIKSMISNETFLAFEIIVVDDGSTDHCCRTLISDFPNQKITLLNSHGKGACYARNIGALHARGKYLLFCDAHIFVQPYWLEELLVCFDEPGIGIVAPGISSYHNSDAVGFGFTLTDSFGVEWLPAPIQTAPALIAPGACAMIPQKVFRLAGGFDQGLRVWGHEDVELSLRYWLLGYQVLVTPEVTIQHIFREKHPYAIAMENIYYNYLRIALCHLNPQRIKKLLQLIITFPQAEEIFADIMLSDAWLQRQNNFSKRLFDDDWLFHKFSVSF